MRTSAGQLHCFTSSSADFSGKIVSDNREHDPEPEGFNSTTGSAPDHWVVQTTCFDGDLEVRVFTSGGLSDMECNLVQVFNQSLVLMGNLLVSGNTGAATPRRQDFSMTGESAVLFRLEKICPTSVRESVTYTVELDMHD